MPSKILFPTVHCPTSITYSSTNSNSILRSMTPSLSFLRWPKCAQRRLCGSIMFVKFSCALISDLSQKISFFFPVSDKISGKQSPSFCRERKLFGTGLFSNKLCLISWSEMRFKSLPIFQFFTKFSFILFRWTLGGEPWWGMLILGNFILWRFLMMSHCQYLSPLMMNLCHYHYLTH